MPNKSNKDGIKIFVLVDLKMFYTQNLKVYVGQQPERSFQVNTDPASIVQRLVQHLAGKGRNLLPNIFEILKTSKKVRLFVYLVI